MAGTTTRYKLPYPTQTDPVYQGATAIENLARRIETVLTAAGIPAPPTAMMADDEAADDG